MGQLAAAARRRLAEAGVEYLHMKELAPTTAMREAQYREDAVRGEGKRSRTTLAPVYVRLYTEQILDPADLSPLIELYPTAGRRCSASSATPRPAIARSSPSASGTTRISRSSISVPVPLIDRPITPLG